MKYASFGTISHGTMRNEDLLDSFASELEYQVQRNAEAWASDDGRVERDRHIKLIGDARDMLATLEAKGDTMDGHDEEGASDIVQELFDALDTFAPPYAYFGATEGDGSDCGYWPSMEAIEDLPRVSDPNEVEGMGEDCVYVNDHGNATVYAADGSIIWDCV